MPHHQIARLSGAVTHVFAHRFVLSTDSGDVLADLTPPGASQVRLAVGDRITVEGEQHPSELKVTRLTRDGRETVIAGPPRPPDEPLFDLKPDDAVRIAIGLGFTPLGAPRRKPRHFEVLGEKDGALAELHIHAEGLRHARPVSRVDEKWQQEISVWQPASLA